MDKSINLDLLISERFIGGNGTLFPTGTKFNRPLENDDKSLNYKQKWYKKNTNKVSAYNRQYYNKNIKNKKIDK